MLRARSKEHSVSGFGGLNGDGAHLHGWQTPKFCLVASLTRRQYCIAAKSDLLIAWRTGTSNEPMATVSNGQSDNVVRFIGDLSHASWAARGSDINGDRQIVFSDRCLYSGDLFQRLCIQSSWNSFASTDKRMTIIDHSMPVICCAL